MGHSGRFQPAYGYLASSERNGWPFKLSETKAGSPEQTELETLKAVSTRHAERKTTMMYATLTLMAALISMMFVATAVSSIVNALRENEAVKSSLRRSAVF